MSGLLRNNNCDCQCRAWDERRAADCIEVMARAAATQNLVMTTSARSRKYADENWLKFVPRKYRDLVSDA